MKNKNGQGIIYVIVLIAVLSAVGYGSWQFKRWFNWKFGYGAMIEPRIEKIEARLDTIEKEIKIMKLGK